MSKSFEEIFAKTSPINIIKDNVCEDHDIEVVAAHHLGALEERKRILDGLDKIEQQAEKTRTPLFQDTLLAKVRELING